MSFNFDHEYWKALERYRDDFVKQGHSIPATPFAGFLDWIEGMVLCDCDHGCRDTAADNVAKLVSLTRAVTNGTTSAELDAMAFKDPDDFTREIHEQVWKEAKGRAEKSREIKD